MKKKIVFLTGTRADFGKLKSLISILLSKTNFEVHIFATGMHLDEQYGFTVREIEKCGFPNIYQYVNHDRGASMDLRLSKTIEGFGNYVRALKPELVVVHGDRIEALAGSTVGALNNILVAHIEGGEVSGTVDELIRHAVSKLSHLHFVANAEARNRLVQMGEREQNIYIIGSPDMDVMLSNKLPDFSEVVASYELPFNTYSISMFHPVTTEVDNMKKHAEQYFDALVESGLNYVVIYPNNDQGSDFIFDQMEQLRCNRKFRLYPSVRFEAFLVMMKHAQFIVGNSSAGIREMPLYGIPTINVGTRQNGRTKNEQIIQTSYAKESILKGIQDALIKHVKPSALFGTGTSNKLFLQTLQSAEFWHTEKQKLFADYSPVTAHA